MVSLHDKRFEIKYLAEVRNVFVRIRGNVFIKDREECE